MRVHITKMSATQAKKLDDKSALDDVSQFAIPGVGAVTPTSTTGIEDATLPPYVMPGRPDVHSIIRRVASECGTDQRILIAACGPSGLSNDVRDAVRNCISIDGPSLGVHLEAFGW